MKANEAKILLQKYFEGETTLEEENALAGFFRQDNLPEEMLPFRKWFAGIEELNSDISPGQFGERAMKFIEEHDNHRIMKLRSLRYTLSGIAASLVIVAGSLIWYFQQPAYPDTFSDPVEAVAYAEKTLAFVSSEYNKGLAKLAPVSSLGTGTRSAARSLKTINNGFYQLKKIKLLNEFKTVD